MDAISSSSSLSNADKQAMPETQTLIVIQSLLLVLCEFGPFSNFVSRKLCHTASGLLMLHLDPADWLARWFVYTVVFSSLAMTWGLTPFAFKFSREKDVGITVYLMIVGAFFYNQLSLNIIKPVFFADPCGAVVGKFLSKQKGIHNPRWIGEKTVGGTLAVFFACILTLIYGTFVQKLMISFVVAIAEGLSKDYDNLFIALVVLVGWYYLGEEGSLAAQGPALKGLGLFELVGGAPEL